MACAVCVVLGPGCARRHTLLYQSVYVYVCARLRVWCGVCVVLVRAVREDTHCYITACVKVHASVRACVVWCVRSAWSGLCEKGALPLERYREITAIVVDRLADKSAISRKAAIQLVTGLLQHNPFGATLNPDVFAQQLEVEVCARACAYRGALSPLG